MFLDNFYTSLKFAGSNDNMPAEMCVVDTSGAAVLKPCNVYVLRFLTDTTAEAPCITRIQTSDTKDTNSGVVFGDGNAPVQSNDYKLSGNVITGITANCVGTHEIVGNSVRYKSKIAITNNNANQITIRELGILCRAFRDGSTTTRRTMFIYRDVLASPVVIEPNGIGEINVEITVG